MSTLYVVNAVLFAFVYCVLSETFSSVYFHQERAQVMYSNPKYVKDVSVFTSRRNRREPYLTNLTMSNFHTFDNNVSASVTLTLKGDDYKISFKVCEALKLNWVIDFLKMSTDIPSRCPVAPGCYHAFNVQLPPKNFPLPLYIDGDYDLALEFFMTETGEKILNVKVKLRGQKGKKTRNK